MTKETMVDTGLDLLSQEFGEERVRAAVEVVKKFQVELPSWVFGEFGGGAAFPRNSFQSCACWNRDVRNVAE